MKVGKVGGMSLDEIENLLYQLGRSFVDDKKTYAPDPKPTKKPKKVKK